MGSISEVLKDDPLHLDSVIPLDFNTLKSVPESHQWALESSNHSVDVMLPVIDLAHPDAPQLVAHAARTWGMFQIVNHGIPLDLIQGVENEARRLFSLPTDEKMKVLRSSENLAGYGVARIAPFYAKCMWHEGFAIHESCVDHAKILWPHDYERFCNTMMEFRKKVKPVADQLLHHLLVSLDISEEAIKIWEASANKVEGTIQLNSYPACPDPSSVIGLAPHTDTLLLTILNQCQISGLQIFRDDVGWISVPPLSGAFVVNVGDILHMLSNGKFPSAYHRVTVSENKHRISFAYFHGPSVDSYVEPLNKLAKPLYRSMSVKEFFVIKAKHNEKALSLVRL
ncbi:gibberellin 3-beta-dioxygenase 1-like [Heracleum sosnowskyi]|uniref:Gibberellin 3-beta-dioxygenase 1-like n=1 Tax=Heracleum sosnowskyi TaxID=360622 RepID=A0AAD8IJD7_9APIA|nr:gibberellin 3-beta-dioxygenase 1-like [Heracleum sosnowskyi]